MRPHFPVHAYNTHLCMPPGFCSTSFSMYCATQRCRVMGQVFIFAGGRVTSGMVYCASQNTTTVCLCVEFCFVSHAPHWGGRPLYTGALRIPKNQWRFTYLRNLSYNKLDDLTWSRTHKRNFSPITLKRFLTSLFSHFYILSFASYFSQGKNFSR